MSKPRTMESADWGVVIKDFAFVMAAALIAAMLAWLGDLPALLDSAGAGEWLIAVVAAGVPAVVAGLRALQRWLFDTDTPRIDRRRYG